MAVHDLVTVFWVEDEQDVPTIRVTMGHALTMDQESIAVYPPGQTTAVQIPRRDMLLRVEITVRETGQDGYPWNIHVRTHSNDGEGEHHEQMGTA